MNRSALRTSARQVLGWFLVFVTGVYVTSYVTTTPENRPAALIYAVVFAAMTVFAFVNRYLEAVRRLDSAAEAAEFADRIAAQRAEHEERVEAARREHEEWTAQREAERAARRQAEEDQARDEIAQGLRCPEWCTDCEADRAESARVNAAWVAERAARHGHPNAQDLAELEIRETVRTA